jgi:hypothetical protein
VDPSKWQLQTIQQIRRGVKRRAPKGGSVIGHSWHGADGQQEETALGLVDARHSIYLPAYVAAINDSAEAQQALQLLAAAARRGPVMLLDYHKNGDPAQPGPLSPVAAVVVPDLEGMLAQPVAELPPPPPPPPPAALPSGDSATDTESETESEDGSSAYYSAVPSLASK